MEEKICKHCGKKMTKVLMPPDTDWGVEYFLICMNDDCQYYVRGWDWMKEKYQVTASYRHKYNPENDSFGPIPVKDPTDYKHYIAE